MKRCEIVIMSVMLMGSLAGCSGKDASKTDFGEVIVAAENVKSYQCKETQFPNHGPSQVKEIYFKGPGVVRMVDQDGRITIDNRVEGKALIYSSKGPKSAILLSMKNAPANDKAVSFAEGLRTIARSSNVQKMGEKVIKGRKTVGFRFT